MLLSRLLLATGLALFAGSIAAQEAPGDGSTQDAPIFLTGAKREVFFADVEKKMSELRSIAATFEQEKRLALFKQPLLSKGQLLFSTPDHLRWEFQEPFRSVLIVSGDRVAKFEKQGGRWRKLEQGRQAEVILVVMDNIRSWFRGQFDQTGKSFSVQVAREPRPIILMSPKEKLIARTLREVELCLADDFTHVVQVTIREVSGDQTVMKFTQIKRKPSDPLPQKYFSLEQVTEVQAENLEQKSSPARDSEAK